MAEKTQKVREPFFAGQFYPFDKSTLKKQLNTFFLNAKVETQTDPVIAGIAPHAGYIYSGQVAAHLYKSLQNMKPETVIVIGPNHTGYGKAVDICGSGKWKTPLGEVDVDEKIAEKIGEISNQEVAEHSVEVQIPFLQHVFEHEFKIVPIHVMDQSIETMEKLGKGLSKALNTDKHLVIASTDFSHYVPQKQAYTNDLRAINAIKNLNIKELYDVIQEFDVSMCGYGPVTAAMTYAKLKGSKSGKLLKYGTSGDVTGDFNSVVGYGALAFY